MALTGSPFPWELWLEICRLAESEYADVDAKHARGIVSGLSALSRSCRTFYNILKPSIYGSPVLVGVRSLELYFRTVVENDNLASLARMVRWYEGDLIEVYLLIEEEISFKIYGVEEDPFEFGDYFDTKYSAKMRGLDIRLPDFYGTRGNHQIMHLYPQLLPAFLPNLKALNYQHNPRIHGYNLLSRSEYRSYDAMPLTDISIRAAREDCLKLTTLLPLFSRSRDTLENLHLEWPLAMSNSREWPAQPLFTKLKKLSVRDGCLGLDSFHKLLFHAPGLEEFVYHSARVSHDDYYEDEAETPGDENDGFLAWWDVVHSLEQVKDTLQRLELDVHQRYFKDFAEFGFGLTDWESLRTVVLGQDAILHEDGEPQARKRLTEILPKRLKHLELRRIQCDYQQIEAFTEDVKDGKYTELETVKMDIKWRYSHKDSRRNLEEIKATLESRGVRTKMNIFEEE